MSDITGSKRRKARVPTEAKKHQRLEKTVPDSTIDAIEQATALMFMATQNYTHVDPKLINAVDEFEKGYDEWKAMVLTAYNTRQKLHDRLINIQKDSSGVKIMPKDVTKLIAKIIEDI
jgi:hypothetical protein